jgi:hypothetical protein
MILVVVASDRVGVVLHVPTTAPIRVCIRDRQYFPWPPFDYGHLETIRSHGDDLWKNDGVYPRLVCLEIAVGVATAMLPVGIGAMIADVCRVVPRSGRRSTYYYLLLDHWWAPHQPLATANFDGSRLVECAPLHG